MKFSVMSLPAVYSVQQDLVLSFMSVWTACYEGKVIGMCMDRAEAEEACRFHAMSQAEYA